MGALFTLILVITGIGLIFGIISRQKAYNMVGILILFAFAIPFLLALFKNINSGVMLLMVIIFGVIIIRWAFNMIFGKGATDRLLAKLLYDIILLPFKLIGCLVRKIV